MKSPLTHTLGVLLAGIVLLLSASASAAAAAQTACTVTYTLSPQNSTSFGASIAINNVGTTSISSWTLSWTFANGQAISSFWNGVESQSGSKVSVSNVSYNGAIAAGSSVTGLGFNGTWNGTTNAVPTAFTLNGVTCTGASVTTGSTLTTPTPGSSLTSSTATFAWTKVSTATAYKLILGTTVGGSDVYNSYTTTATSATVKTIPTNGATLYATLYTEIASKWSSNAYTYNSGGSSSGSFTMSTATSSLSLRQGSTTTNTIQIVGSGGFSGKVALTLSSLPSGVTATWSANPTSGQSVLTLTATSTAALGTTSVSVTGTSGTLGQTLSFSLTVAAANTSGFTLSAASTALNLQQDTGVSDIITVNDTGGFTGSVSFGISGLPTGVTPNFQPSTTTTSTLLTLAVATTVTPGTYPLTIVGSSSVTSGSTSTSLTSSVMLTLTVSAGTSLRIAWVSPTSGIAGSTVTILPGGNGTSFGATQGTSTIYFGTTEATVTSWAVNSIQVTVPKLTAGSVNVTAVVGGITSNAVPFVITSTKPSPTTYYSNSTYFGGTGAAGGGCGVPATIQDTQNYVALNVQNDPGNYTLTLSRPITAEYANDIGTWNNGLNCERWLHVKIGKACQGENDGGEDETFCRGGAGWVDDPYEGAELDMIVHDSCQDSNGWCRDDPYHLDLFQESIDNFVLNGTAVGNLLANWTNRQLIWYFEPSPNYTGDINVYLGNGSGEYYTQILLTHLPNGLHGVDYYANGVWNKGTMVSDNGGVYTISPTTTNGGKYQIRVYDADDQLINNGRVYSFGLPSSCSSTCGSITQVTYTTNTTSVTALTTPAPGSTLTGSSATFAWTKADNVTACKLILGTTAGASDVYNSYTTTATSVGVKSIPTTGATLYATLYYEISGVWSSNSYTYIEK